jgi:hypothetical protein
MFKSISSQRNLGARIFLGGLLFGSIGGFAQHAWATWRTYPADSHCVKDPSATVGWICGTNIGSDFLAANLTSSEIDFMYSNTATDTIRAYSCRDSWNLTTSSCGSPAVLDLTTIHTPAVITQIYPELSAMKAGSQYDYRYVTISATKGTTMIDPKGVFLGGT